MDTNSPKDPSPFFRSPKLFFVILVSFIVILSIASIILFFRLNPKLLIDNNNNLDNTPLSENTTCKNKKIYKSLEEAKNDKQDPCLLDLSGQKLKSITSEVARLPLEKIDLSNNEFKEIPRELKNIPMLSYLNLSNNKINRFARDIQDLQSIKTLNLSHNRIERFPQEANFPPTLTTLDLSYNDLREIPKISNLKNLKKLIITGNRIEKSKSGNGDIPIQPGIEIVN